MTSNTNLKDCLTYSLRNLFSAGIQESAKNAPPVSEKNSVLYRIKEDNDLSKNTSYIVLTNISDQPLVIPAGYILKIYWNDILNNKTSESNIGLTYEEGGSSNPWTTKFHSENAPPSRYWKLELAEAILLQPKSELKFKASNIPINSQEARDNASLKFLYEYKATPTSSLTKGSLVTTVYFFNLEGSPVDSAALPIVGEYGTPRMDNSWNVAQNKVLLLHPDKKDSEVFSNTLEASTIESRLAFGIRNPSSQPLLPKSASADPRFVISISYGDNNVRALSRMEGEQSPSTGQRSTFQGIELNFDGIVGGANQDMTFVKSVSDISGTKSWTFRPQNKDFILQPSQLLCLVFNGICPDNTVGDAYITIGYYDIKGYKDGLLTTTVKKVQPKPYLIKPEKPPTIEVYNPKNQKAICLSWQVFGVDSVKLTSTRRDSNNQSIVTEIAQRLPSVIEEYSVTLSDSLWEDLELNITIQNPTSQSGVTTHKIADIQYKGALGVKWRKSVHRSDWVRCNSLNRRMRAIHHNLRTTQFSQILGVYERKMNETFSRLTLKYQGGENWDLIIECIDFNWESPYVFELIKEYLWMPAKEQELKPSYRDTLRGGGYFSLENLQFYDDGSVSFSVKGDVECVVPTGSPNKYYEDPYYHKKSVTGTIRNVDGEPEVSYDFISQISGSQNSDSCSNYPYSTGGADKPGILRPPIFRFQYLNTSIEGAEKASERVYAVHDVKTDGKSTLQRLKANNDQQPPRSSTRSIEIQNFQGQSLQEQDFRQTNLEQANFDGAVLQGANFESSSLAQASFKGANLVLVNGSYAYLKGANLMEAQLNYAKFCGAIFDEANLTGASLIGANLSSAYFIGANLTNTNFDTAIVQDAVFTTDSGLSEEQVQDLQQRGANFVERPETVSPPAQVVSSLASSAVPPDPESKTIVPSAQENQPMRNLRGAVLPGAEMSYKDLSYIDFSDADLSGADLSHSNLSYTKLANANLAKTNLTQSNLTGADLTGAILSETNLTDATVTQARFGSNSGLADDVQQVLSEGGALMGEPELPQTIDDLPQPIESIPTLAESPLYKPAVRPRYL